MKFNSSDEIPTNAYGGSPIIDIIDSINELSDEQQQNLFRTIIPQLSTMPKQLSIEKQIQLLPLDRQKDIAIAIIKRL
jgi:hypothetical protein